SKCLLPGGRCSSTWGASAFWLRRPWVRHASGGTMMDLIRLYGRASEWTLSKVPGAKTKLDFATPCDEWDVRELLNHMLETQQFFVGTAPGGGFLSPSPNASAALCDAPVADFEHA